MCIHQHLEPTNRGFFYMETNQQGHRFDEADGEKKVLRLLVVEDHSDVRWALQAFVAALGYEAQFAKNMATALHAADEQSYDVLLCDIGLPDGDGWDLLRRLEASGHRPPYAIAMSVLNLGEDVARSIAAGFALHLFKPFPPGALQKALALVPARTATPVLAS